MSQSWSAIERGNPPPRHKACTSCTKAKRRCDLAQPTCTRCSQREYRCIYPQARSGHSRRGPKRPHEPATTAALESAVLAFSNETEDFLLDHQATSCGTDLLLHGDDMLDGNLLGLTCSEDSSLPLSQTLLTETTEDIEHYQEVIHAENLLVLHEDLDLYSVLIRNRFQYSIDVLTSSPSLMVRDNALPWSHPALYRDHMPRSMEDVYSSCGLYTAKNPTNASLILRTICARARELAAAPPPQKTKELLAHVQAMLLYTIILLFDGDIHSRATAERHISTLEAATMELGPRLDSAHTSEEIFGLNAWISKPPLWTEWIVQESARRTSLVVFFSLLIYRILRGDRPSGCDYYKTHMCHSWTASSWLWSAGNAVEFAQAWDQKKYMVVDSFDVRPLLQSGRPEDMEQFTKMMVSALMGIDEFRAWMGRRGGFL